MPLTDPRVVALVCDACHRGLPGITAQPHAWPVLWRIAVDRGWSGHRNHLVLDLHGVHLVDSTALGVLVRAHQRLKPHRGKVCLVAPSQFVRVVLHTMHLETVFPMFEAAGAALDRLAGTTWITHRDVLRAAAGITHPNPGTPPGARRRVES